jgi:hypothetical protein
VGGECRGARCVCSIRAGCGISMAVVAPWMRMSLESQEVRVEVVNDAPNFPRTY